METQQEQLNEVDNRELKALAWDAFFKAPIPLTPLRRRGRPVDPTFAAQCISDYSIFLESAPKTEYVDFGGTELEKYIADILKTNSKSSFRLYPGIYSESAITHLRTLVDEDDIAAMEEIDSLPSKRLTVFIWPYTIEKAGNEQYTNLNRTKIIDGLRNTKPYDLGELHP